MTAALKSHYVLNDTVTELMLSQEIFNNQLFGQPIRIFQTQYLWIYGKGWW